MDSKVEETDNELISVFRVHSFDSAVQESLERLRTAQDAKGNTF